MRSRWSLPLRGWLTVVMVAIILTPLISWIGLLVAVQGPLKTSPTPWERKAQEQREATVTLVEGRATEWANPAFQSELRQLLTDSAISVALFDRDGRFLFRSDSFDQVAQIDQSPDESHAEWIDSMGDTQYLRLIHDHAGGLIGFYVLVQHGFDPFNFALLFAILGGLTIAMLLAVWWVGRSINQPIQALAAAAKAVSQEQLAFSVPTSRIREVNQLATAFAAMRDGLRSSIESQAQMEQERRLLIAGIAHDLRTPLASVRGYLEGLQDGIARTPERMAHYVAVALEKTGHLERLITDLFAFAQAEYLNLAPRREPVQLGALLQEVTDGLAVRASSTGVRLQRLSAEPITLQADPAMLTRVVENLIDNALRHTPAGGSVTVGYQPEAGGCLLWVADTGPGIPEGALERIFDPLYRGDESRGTRTGGAGLGLAIARRFVEAHGGRIWAENRGGARFTIWLPTE